MKWLTISKPYVAASYRNKLHHWSVYPEIENHLVVPFNWGASSWEDSVEDSKHRLNIIKLPTVFNGKNHFFFFRNLESVIREIKPDYLNVEEEHYSLVTYQALRLAKKYKIPMSFYTWQNIYKRYPFPFSYFERQVFEYCKFAFAGNEEAKEVLRQKKYKGDICVIPQMGINTHEGSTDLLSAKDNDDDSIGFALKRLKPGGFRFLYAGRMVEEKGIFLLRDAFRNLLSRDKEVRLILVGSGPLRDELKNSLADLENSGLALWLDSVESHAMHKIYKQVHCLVLPSITRKNWKEQFGRVLVEAMFHKVLCIGSSSGEIPNVIAEQKQIFSENSLESLCKVMSEVVAMRDESRNMLLEKHRERAINLYSNATIARKQYEFCVERIAPKVST